MDEKERREGKEMGKQWGGEKGEGGRGKRRGGEERGGMGEERRGEKEKGKQGRGEERGKTRGETEGERRRGGNGSHPSRTKTAMEINSKQLNKSTIQQAKNSHGCKPLGKIEKIEIKPLMFLKMNRLNR